MKMSIRIKFFIILIAFSLGPMLFSRTLMGREATQAAQEMADKTRQEMHQIINAELETNAVSLMQYLEARGQMFSIGVQLLAKSVEHALFWERPVHDLPNHMTTSFGKSDQAPADQIESPVYLRKVRRGEIKPVQVSMEHAAFKLPMHEAVPDAEETMYRLNSVVDTIKDIHREHGFGPYWYNVGLDSGLFMTYPGHGQYPMRWDHREQAWYHSFKGHKNKVAWTMPEIDPVTRLAITSLSTPIHDPEGNFVGAVGMDIPLSSILEEASLKSRWSDKIQSFLVKLHPGEKPEDGYLLILAQQAYDDTNRRSWMSGIEAEYMVANDGENTTRLIRAMTESESGVIRLPYKGEDCVWAYASNKDFSFLLIIPEAVATQLPDQVAGSISSIFERIRTISLYVSGLAFVVVGLIAWFGSRKVTRPLLHMASAAKRLARGDFSTRIDMHTGDERDQLINAFNEMGPKLQEHLHLRRDMELAQQVQQLLLPANVPELEGWEISGGIEFCDETGGDYYDFIPMTQGDNQCLGVVLGDVSGHGVPSALMMATVRGQLHSLSKAPLRPCRRIQAINTVLSRDLDGTGRFLTLFYLRLCANDSEVIWVRAGHDPAIRYTPETDEFSQLNGEGLPLGVLEEYTFEEYSTQLHAGEILLLATDGVWEARNEEGEMFGKERMLAIIRENAHNPIETVRKAIVQAVEKFQANGQEDDIAVVVIKRVQS